jgi:hypothetical protein
VRPAAVGSDAFVFPECRRLRGNVPGILGSEDLCRAADRPAGCLALEFIVTGSMHKKKGGKKSRPLAIESSPDMMIINILR